MFVQDGSHSASEKQMYWQHENLIYSIRNCHRSNWQVINWCVLKLPCNVHGRQTSGVTRGLYLGSGQVSALGPVATGVLEGFAMALGQCAQGLGFVFFFFSHGNMGAGQDSRSDICLTCCGVGRQPGHASGPGTWKQFQVLHFRHHNRSVKHFYPQVHFEHYMYTNSAGTHPDYLSICTRKQPEADQPKNRECRWLPDVAYLARSSFGR